MNTEQIILKSRPKGLPTLENFKMEEIEIPEIKNNEVLLEGMYYSVDPYMRGRMNDTKSYAPPFETGKPLSGGVVAKVIESKSEKFQVGDIITGNLPWRKKNYCCRKRYPKNRFYRGTRQLLPRHFRHDRTYFLFRTYAYWQTQSWRNSGCFGCCWSSGHGGGTDC